MSDIEKNIEKNIKENLGEGDKREEKDENKVPPGNGIFITIIGWIFFVILALIIVVAYMIPGLTGAAILGPLYILIMSLPITAATGIPFLLIINYLN